MRRPRSRSVAEVVLARMPVPLERERERDRERERERERERRGRTPAASIQNDDLKISWEERAPARYVR